MSAPAATPAASAALQPFAEPRKAVTGGWIAAFATAWLGIWMAQLAPVQLLLPHQVDVVRDLVGSTDWLQSVVAFGIISGIAGACALIAYPLTGALSDRTTSRFGRRRPWIAGGAVLFAVSLAFLGLQNTYVGLGIFWSLALTGFCVLTAALTATISDQVPVAQRGFVSGWVSAPQAIGTVLGLLLVVYVITSQVLGYIVLGVLLLVLVLPFLLVAKDAVLTREQRPKLSRRAFLSSMWISPRKYPDFAWTLTSRILINLGNALGTTMLLYFLTYGLKVDAPDDDIILLSLIYTVFVVIASLVLGRLSDSWGRRKPFVTFAAILQALAAILLALAPSFPVAMFAGALLGLGYGCFLSVDQALATQVLPDPADRGKDLGIMNIASAVPQAVAPLLGAFVVVSLGGFVGLFLLSGLFALLGAATVAPVKSVQ
ncbi:MAG TPA: MFS transporter [Pseudolysinimonas sp.]|jgi:MFS family permease|nr:MFS transporter [Pseudolysinimonas sp.]